MQDQIPPDADLAEKLKFLAPVALAVLAGTARFLMLPKGQSALAYVRGILMAVLVAWIVAAATDGYGMNENYRVAAIGVCSFMADDLLRGLLALGEEFRKDPFGFIKRWFKRGGK